MRRVMIHQDDAAVGEPRAELQMQARLGPCRKGRTMATAIHVFRLRAGHGKTGRDRRIRQVAYTVLPRHFHLFNGGDKLAILHDGSRGVAEDSPNSQNNHVFSLLGRG